MDKQRFWREFDHTGDAGIEVHARSRGELFADAAAAMARMMVEADGIRAIETRRVRARAGNDADLMHGLLAAALNLFVCDAFIWCGAQATEEQGNSIAVDLQGEKFDSRRHQLLTEIKAVTYHELKVEHANGRWTARIVFDI